MLCSKLIEYDAYMISNARVVGLSTSRRALPMMGAYAGPIFKMYRLDFQDELTADENVEISESLGVGNRENPSGNVLGRSDIKSVPAPHRCFGKDLYAGSGLDVLPALLHPTDSDVANAAGINVPGRYCMDKRF